MANAWVSSVDERHYRHKETNHFAKVGEVCSRDQCALLNDLDHEDLVKEREVRNMSVTNTSTTNATLVPSCIAT